MAVTKEQADDIKDVRSSKTLTARATSPLLEEILHEPIDVLDKGFVRVVDYMGNDSSVVQAARVSYGKGTKQVREDRGLIRYLLRHKHTTPFEMADIKLHVKLPIFVARQWIRHRTASINEYSARYSILDKEFYVPGPEQLAAQSSTNRQGRGLNIGAQESEFVLNLIRADSEHAYTSYKTLLNEGDGETVADTNRTGIARELARMNLTLNYYTQWYWKTNLHNLMHFLELRADSHAQYEIRVYAEVIMDILKKWVPETYSAFVEYHLGSSTLSSTETKVLKQMLNKQEVTQETSGLSTREWSELVQKFDLP